MHETAKITINNLPEDEKKTPLSVFRNKALNDRRGSQQSGTNSIGKLSVDFETAISKTGYGKFNFFVILLTFPATCTSGFDTSSISMVMPILEQEFNLTDFQKGCLNSAVYAGMISSAFLWGFVSDTFGRQKLLAYGYLLDALMCFCAGLSNSFWMLSIFKFLSGFMICGPYSIFMTYLSEVFNNKYRDLAMLSAGFFFAIGSIIQPALALALVPMNVSWSIFEYELKSWRLFLCICALPSFIAGSASAFCVESPKFLMDKGRKEEALKVFQTIYTINTGLPKNTYPVRKLHTSISRISETNTTNNTPTVKPNVIHVLKKGFIQTLDIFKPPYLYRAIFAFSIQCGGLAALNGIRLILPELFSLIETPATDGKLQIGNSTICHILGCISSEKEITTIAKNGTNEVFVDSHVYTDVMWIYVFCLFTHCIFSIAVRFVTKKLILSFTSLLAGICVILMTMMNSSYVLPLAAFYISLLNVNFYAIISVLVLLFPTRLRATSVCLSMMFGRFGVLVGNLILTQVLYKYCSIVFSVLGTILIVIAISHLFMPSAPAESTHVKRSVSQNNENCN